jgi:hypothetical protein
MTVAATESWSTSSSAFLAACLDGWIFSMVVHVALTRVERVASERIGRETVTYVGNIYKYYVSYRLIQGEYIRRREVKKTTGSGPS